MAGPSKLLPWAAALDLSLYVDNLLIVAMWTGMPV
jgi:hypothetical protein